MEVTNTLPVTNQIATPTQQFREQNLAREETTAANRSEDQDNPQNITTVSAPVESSARPDTAALQAAGERVGTLLDVQA